MCTVSFIPKSSGSFILTSNRDEEPGRKTRPPKLYRLDGTDVLFPKDEVAGGTWIGVSGQKRLVCLLNGGFIAHQRKKKYRMSRGIIVTDLLTTHMLMDEIKAYDFTDIEPFTIILVEWEKEIRLIELIWDGHHSHISEKPLVPTIWSSSLLYSKSIKDKREGWFLEFLDSSMNLTAESLLHFHKTAGDGSGDNDLIMDRGFVKTKSITQIVLKEKTSFRYEDLQKNEVTKATFQFRANGAISLNDGITTLNF